MPTAAAGAADAVGAALAGAAAAAGLDAPPNPPLRNFITGIRARTGVTRTIMISTKGLSQKYFNF